MELIVISDTKLKMMLDDAEMQTFAIQEMDFPRYGKRIFTELFEEAKRQCGFDATGGRVLVQMYPCRRGGCELFVTKLPAASASLRNVGERAVPQTLAEVCCNSLPSGRVIYRFQEMRHLLSTCACLIHVGYDGQSLAYHDPAGVYYLFLERETCYAGEHFGKLCPASRYYYIHEHCRLLCKDAVPVLGALA